MMQTIVLNGENIYGPGSMAGGFVASHTCTSSSTPSKEQSVQVSDTTMLITAPSARHQKLTEK